MACAACYYWQQKIKLYKKNIASHTVPVPFNIPEELTNSTYSMKKIKNLKEKLKKSKSNEKKNIKPKRSASLKRKRSLNAKEKLASS